MRRPRARLIYNPTSGKEANRHNLPDILDVLERGGGFEVSCAMTHGANDAIAAAQQASREEFEYVFAAGGDGTINEVINGLAEMEHRPTLGILPSGTTNDLARALGLSRDFRKSCEIINQRHAVPMDVGQVGDHYFINIAGCGRLTEITYEVPIKMKTHLGQLAYYMKGLEKLPFLKPIHLELDSPDFAYDGKVMLCLIANSNSVGGFEKMVPDASLQDGLFDVLLVKNCTIPELVKLATLALRGEHLTSDRVVYFKTDQLSVSSNEDHVDLNLDGEYGGMLPQTFRCLKHHLNVLVSPR